MGKTFKSSFAGISFEYPNYWELQGDQPPQYAFVTKGEQVLIVLAPSPMDASNLEEAIDASLGGMPRSNNKEFVVSSGSSETTGKSFEVNVPGQGHIKMYIFKYKKLVYMFQVQGETTRSERELLDAMKTITFSRADICNQPVTSINCKSYFSSKGNFQISVSSDWNIKEDFGQSGNESCKRIVKFSYQEDDEDISLSLTVSTQKLPLSVTTKEFCTMIQNHICKSGIKYAIKKEEILEQPNTTCFAIDKPNGTKCCYCPIAYEGTGYILTTKSQNADFMVPRRMFSQFLRSFTLTSSPFDTKYHQYVNFEPYFTAKIPINFDIKSIEMMGATQYLHNDDKNVSFTAFVLDLTHLQGLPDVYTFLAMNWQQAQINVEHVSTTKTTISGRNATNVIVKGDFEKNGILFQSQITYFNTGKYSVALIWQSPVGKFLEAWNGAGNQIFSSVECE